MEIGLTIISGNVYWNQFENVSWNESENIFGRILKSFLKNSFGRILKKKNFLEIVFWNIFSDWI